MNIVHVHSKRIAMLCYFYFQAVGGHLTLLLRILNNINRDLSPQSEVEIPLFLLPLQKEI